METDVFWLVLMPLAAALATGVYHARRDHGRELVIEERIRKNESDIAALQSSGDGSLLDSVIAHAGQLGANTQAIDAHGERLDELEKDE